MEIKNRLRNALYTSLVGKQDEALLILGEIRDSLPFDKYPDIAIELIAIEGVCFGYLGDLATSMKRHQVALALAEKYASEEVRQFALVWHALAQYNNGDLLSAVNSVALLARSTSIERPDVRFRACSLIAMLTAYAELPCAKDWFDLALSWARSSGVHAMFSVVLYNYASLQVSNLALGKVENGSDWTHENVEEVLLFLRSAKNYDHLANIDNQAPLHDLMIAQCLSLLNRYSEAIEFFESFLGSDCQTRPSERAKAMLELRVCQIKIGARVDGDDFGDQMWSCLTEPDDLAIVHHHLSFIHSSLAGCKLKVKEHNALALAFLERAKQLRKKTCLAICDAGLDNVDIARGWAGRVS
jgi:tetratricopeptide (TPR) repeat protein